MGQQDSLGRTIQIRLRQAAIISGLGILVAGPYLQYLTGAVGRGQAGLKLGSVSLREMVTTDFLAFAFLLILTSLVGCFLSQRYKLAGVGSRAQIQSALPFVMVGGVVLGVGSYALFGRHIAALAPAAYPSALGWALLMAFKGALIEETVARFGMMTIICGLVRRPLIANVVQAIFFTGLAFKAFIFFAIPVSALVLASLASTFVVQLCLGGVYAKYGFISAALLHFVIDLRFVLHACLT